MLLLKMKQGEFEEADASRVEQAIEGLDQTLKPLLAGAIAHQAGELGLSAASLASPRPEPIPGLRRSKITTSELFSRAGEVVAVQLIAGDRRVERRPDGDRLVRTPASVRLHGIGPTGAEELMDEVARALGESLAITFEPWQYESSRFDELRDEEGMTPGIAPTEDERAAASLLSDSLHRTAAVAIASSGGLLVADLPKQLPDGDRERAEEVSMALQDAGLVTSELLVTCRRTSGQVARVPSKEAIAAAAREGLKCPSCGRTFSEERADEALALTEQGRTMLDGSRWLSIRLAIELMAVGVDSERMLVEQTSGGDESDCLADISGELVFFELKDKEFSLGSAYSFGSKIAVFRPERSVVVTTAYVGNDAKEHFQKARPSQSREQTYGSRRDPSGEIAYIEGIDNLRDELRTIAGEIYASDATTVLSEILTGAALDPRRTVDALAEAQADTDSEPRGADPVE